MKGVGLKDILLKGKNSALKNHDLVRALVRAQLAAAMEVIDINSAGGLCRRIHSRAKLDDKPLLPSARQGTGRPIQ